MAVGVAGASVARARLASALIHAKASVRYDCTRVTRAVGRGANSTLTLRAVASGSARRRVPALVHALTVFPANARRLAVRVGGADEEARVVDGIRSARAERRGKVDPHAALALRTGERAARAFIREGVAVRRASRRWNGERPDDSAEWLLVQRAALACEARRAGNACASTPRLPTDAAEVGFPAGDRWHSSCDVPRLSSGPAPARGHASYRRPGDSRSTPRGGATSASRRNAALSAVSERLHLLAATRSERDRRDRAENAPSN